MRRRTLCDGRDVFECGDHHVGFELAVRRREELGDGSRCELGWPDRVALGATAGSNADALVVADVAEKGQELPGRTRSRDPLAPDVVGVDPPLRPDLARSPRTRPRTLGSPRRSTSTRRATCRAQCSSEIDSRGTPPDRACPSDSRVRCRPSEHQQHAVGRNVVEAIKRSESSSSATWTGANGGHVGLPAQRMVGVGTGTMNGPPRFWYSCCWCTISSVKFHTSNSR